jgi:quercetin dioxygenase-like cupin family protein
MKGFTLALAVLAGTSLQAQQGQPSHSAPQAVVATPAAIRYGPAPDILPSGAKLAVIDGDPTKPGAYTMRLSMPDGYTLPPHFHPADEHVTVVEGEFLVGMGEKLDPAKFTALPAGSYGMLPTGMRHFARAKGSTIIQLHGVGPWSLTYVNRADDPRHKAR